MLKGFFIAYLKIGLIKVMEQRGAVVTTKSEDEIYRPTGYRIRKRKTCWIELRTLWLFV